MPVATAGVMRPRVKVKAAAFVVFVAVSEGFYSVGDVFMLLPPIVEAALCVWPSGYDVTTGSRFVLV